MIKRLFITSCRNCKTNFYISANDVLEKHNETNGEYSETEDETIVMDEILLQ